MAITLDGTNGVSAPAAALTTPLPVTSGGTGATSLSGITTGKATNIAGGAAGQLPYQSATDITSFVANGTSGQILTSNGASAPAWSSTLTNPTVTNYVETAYTANSSTAITLDLSNGTVQIITLTGSPTITMPTAVAGKSFIMYLKTGAGSFTVTWSTVKWAGGTAPTVTATASKMDIYSFFSDGTNWYGVTVGQNYTP